MIGVNDLDVTDYESDGGQKISTDFLSEFAAINGKIKNKIETGEDRYLNISVEGDIHVDLHHTVEEADLKCKAAEAWVESSRRKLSDVAGRSGALMEKHQKVRSEINEIRLQLDPKRLEKKF